MHTCVCMGVTRGQLSPFCHVHPEFRPSDYGSRNLYSLSPSPAFYLGSADLDSGSVLTTEASGS